METLSYMAMTSLDRMLLVGDAGRVTGERQERPDPEVPERARRRTFTAQYKQQVLAAYGGGARRGERRDPAPGGPVLQFDHRPLRGRRAVKTAGALGDDLRGRGHRARVEAVTDEAIALLAPQIGTWYRRHRVSPPVPKAVPVPHAERVQPRALAPAERQAILDALHSERFADLAPG